MLRRYSSAFSRTVFSEIIDFEDFSHLDWLINNENNQSKFNTYLDYFKHLYSTLKKEYRCEYFFKNEIITEYILKKLGTKNSIVFNEFRVGESIVDLAMMNGESKAFEIKTDFDSPKRLIKQIEDYSRIFNKVYLVVSIDKLNQYLEIIPEEVGILTLVVQRNRVHIKIYRDAISNEHIDCNLLMQCLRISEYKNIVLKYYGFLPTTHNGDAYTQCLAALKQIPQSTLNQLFLYEVKKRKTVTASLYKIPSEFRQICLSLNLSSKKIDQLFNLLNNPINNRRVCISRI